MKLEFVDPTSPMMINYIHTKGESGKATVFTFFSLLNYGIQLPNLAPREPVMRHLSMSLNVPESEEIESREFDMMYAEQLVSDKATFFDLLKIMSCLQTNGNSDEVIVVTEYHNPVVMQVVDSLAKFIQGRYGIQSYIVSYPEDIDPYAISEFEDTFRYLIYLKDIEWYESMQKRMSNAI